ncbi:MAG: enolase C-terminal domain-like protein [Pseudomonadota bacterium]|nr:enolase C-terminal domain-like protein [Pseudomonadota bacterium]
MKITRIEVHKAELAYAGGVYRLSGGREYTSFDATILSLHFADGTVGWGESTPFGSTYVAGHAGGVRAALDLLAPAVTGLDPRCHDRVQDRMDAVLTGHAAAKTAIDVACWDAHGKAAGMPVCDLLGGRIDAPVPVISSIGSDTPDAMRASVARHREAGFRGHSVKIGAGEAEGGPALDAERISACLADRQPGEWYLADANGGMTPEGVLRMLAHLPEGTDIVIEAPCPSWRETLSLRARCRLPILLDELIQDDADLIHAIATDACDGIGLKISKQGGLTASQRQRAIASAAGMVMSVQDTTGSEISFAAILHMAQSTPRHLLRCALDPRSMVSTRIAEFDAPVINGGATAPDLPGLGVAPDPDAIGAPVAVYEGT